MGPREELMSPPHVMHIPGKQFFPLYFLFPLHLSCQGLDVERIPFAVLQKRCLSGAKLELGYEVKIFEMLKCLISCF